MRKRRKPLRTIDFGQISKMSDEELDRLAEVSPVDIEEAKRYWRENVNARYRYLLDAEEQGGAS